MTPPEPQTPDVVEGTLPNDVREFVEQATLLATNHGGWFDTHGFNAISPLCDKGNALLEKYAATEQPAIVGGVDREATVEALHNLIALARPFMRDDAQRLGLIEAEQVLAALTPRPSAPAEVERCPDCYGSGDLIRLDGEWMGYCHCAPIEPPPAPVESKYKQALQKIAAQLDTRRSPYERMMAMAEIAAQALTARPSAPKLPKEMNNDQG